MAIKTRDSEYFKNTVKGITSSRDSIQKYVDEQRNKNRVDTRLLARLLGLDRQRGDQRANVLRQPSATTIPGMVKDNPLEFRQDKINTQSPIQNWVTRQKVTSTIQSPMKGTAYGGAPNIEQVPQGFKQPELPKATHVNYLLPGEQLQPRVKGALGVVEDVTNKMGISGLTKQAGEMLIPDFSKMSEPERIAMFVTMGFSDLASPLSQAFNGVTRSVNTAIGSGRKGLNLQGGIAQAYTEATGKTMGEGITQKLGDWLAFNSAKAQMGDKTAIGNWMIKNMPTITKEAEMNIIARYNAAHPVLEGEWSQVLDDAVNEAI